MLTLSTFTLRQALFKKEGISIRYWLKKLRNESGLTMKQVAELSGISESYYQMIETGKRGNPLNVDIAKNIATALNFKWTLFYVEIGTKFALPYLDGGENNDKTNPSS